LSPDWPGLRPTSDRLRGTLFDVLGDRIEGVRLLDGCAGTGAVGIEALSRGAAYVVFVERDARAVALIRRNVVHCDLGDRCTIQRGELPRALDGDAAPYDLILLDPPYGSAPGAQTRRRSRPWSRCGRSARVTACLSSLVPSTIPPHSRSE